jgi:hypothetical protein
MRPGTILRMYGGTYCCIKSGDEYSVEEGQKVKVLDEWCRKTGLREDDGSAAFGDRGTIVVIEMIGGALDGMRVQFHSHGDLGY